jgi:hypothetical protein
VGIGEAPGFDAAGSLLLEEMVAFRRHVLLYMQGQWGGREAGMEDGRRGLMLMTILERGRNAGDVCVVCYFLWWLLKPVREGDGGGECDAISGEMYLLCLVCLCVNRV